MRHLVALIAAALAQTAVSDDTYYTGDGTAYTLGEPSAGNCNFMAWGPTASTNYAAINAEQWNDMGNCGRCAQVWCVDDSCADQTTSEVVYILDQCPECSSGDLDLSPMVFTSITGSDPSRLSIKWKFVDCPVSGNLKYCLKSGSNSYWTAIQPANMVTGVKSLTIDSESTSMVTSAYYFLTTAGTDLSSVKVSVTSVSGEVVTETVSLTAGSCTTGSSQFSTGTSASSSTSTTTPITTASSPTPTTDTPTTTASTPTTTTATPTTTTATSTTTPATETTSSATSSAASASETSSSSSTTTDSASKKQTTTTSTSATFTSAAMTYDGSNSTFVVGTVTAASDESSGTTGTFALPTTSSAASSTGSEDSTQTANTQSSSSSGTSGVFIAFAVVGVVGVGIAVAFAVVAKKKKLDDKVNDRDDSMMHVRFGDFNTPVKMTQDIATL